MSGWEGYGVSVRCGALGCYQGTVAAADGGSLTLTKPFRNGFPYPKARVTLKASDIESLEIISEREEGLPAHSTVLAGAAGRRRARATVGERLQAPEPHTASTGSSNADVSGKPAAAAAGGWPAAPEPGGGAAGGGGGAAGAAGAGGGAAGAGGGAAGAGGGAAGAGGAARARAAPARSKPIDIQGPRPQRTNNTHAGSLGASGSLPKARGAGGGGGAAGGAGGGGGGGGGAGGERARRRNEACFGAAADEFSQDFDFEGNLALFDKQALWQQMRPDVVRVAAARDELAAGGGGGGKLRHDQHVLRRAAPDTQPVTVPLELRGPTWYATDEGVVVPSLTAAARRRLWRALAAAPGQLGPALTLLARAVADVALRLMGGPRRLDPRNAHQRPVFCAALGVGAAAAAGAEAARLLAAHGVATALAAPPRPCALLAPALAAYRAAGGRLLAPGAARPRPDVLLLALHDPDSDQLPDDYEQLAEWGLRTRGALLVLEGLDARLAAAARAALAALLPGAGGGRVLLANVAPPPALFAALGVAYRPPFGAHSVLALHPHDPDPDPEPASAPACTLR